MNSYEMPSCQSFSPKRFRPRQDYDGKRPGGESWLKKARSRLDLSGGGIGSVIGCLGGGHTSHPTPQRTSEGVVEINGLFLYDMANGGRPTRPPLTFAILFQKLLLAEVSRRPITRPFFLRLGCRGELAPDTRASTKATIGPPATPFLPYSFQA